MDISARFADSKDTHILSEKQYKSVPSELGDVFLPSADLQYAEKIKLGLRSYLWKKRITIEGIKE